MIQATPIITTITRKLFAEREKRILAKASPAEPVNSNMAAENFATHQGAEANMELKVNSPNTQYTEDYIIAQYNYEKNLVNIVGNTGYSNRHLI